MPDKDVLEQRVKKFIEIVSKDFSLSSPDVKVLDSVENICGPNTNGCYHADSKTIYLKTDAANSIITVLHEFAHYIQHYLAGWDAQKAFPPSDFTKKWEERRHEREAVQLSSELFGAYASLFDKIIKNKRFKVTDGKAICGYVASDIILKNMEAAIDYLDSKMSEQKGDLDKAQRMKKYVREELETANTLMKILPLVCPANKKDVEEAKTYLEDALKQLEEGTYMEVNALISSNLINQSLRKK